MPKLFLSLVLALIGTLAAVSSPASATTEQVGPPGMYFRGNLGIYTTTPDVRLRIDRGDVEMPDAVGEESLSWDVQVLRTDMRTASRPAWRPARTATTARYHSFRVSSGDIICVRARQHSWGVTGGWSSLTCVARALDDEHLRRRGSVKVVPDPRYADDRASVLLATTRVVIGGVPAGAMYGPVYTDRGISPSGARCTFPTWRMRGYPTPSSATGVSTGALRLRFHRTSVAGTAIMRSPFGRTCPVGGFLVVPRWMPR